MQRIGVFVCIFRFFWEFRFWEHFVMHPDFKAGREY